MVKKENTYYKIITTLFIIALLLPNIVHLSGIEKSLINNENRKLTEVPEINLKKPIKSIGKFKNYYLENFGLKTILVNKYIDIKSTVLNENPIPNRTIKGKNGWHFLGNKNNNVLNNSFGNDSFTERELEKTVDYLVTINEYFKSQHIAFYLVVPSDKNRIYQEFLPYQLNQNKAKLEILKQQLKSTTDIKVIDLTQILLEGKKTERLYYKTDTHWNFDGAFLGYNHTMDIIKNNLAVEKTNKDDYWITKKEYKKGDLLKMINTTKNETINTYVKKVKSEVQVVYIENKKMKFKNPSKTLKMMQFRDSFADNWYSFFNESFAETIYLRKYTFTKKEIEDFKPDIVIFEIIERNIDLFSELKPFKN